MSPQGNFNLDPESYDHMMSTTTNDIYPFMQTVEKSGLIPQSSNYSPAMSIAHYVSASDCGTSGPSTISSARGSPSLSGQHNPEWQAGLLDNIGILPEAINGEHNYNPFDFEAFAANGTTSCMDPSLIEPYPTTASMTSARYAAAMDMSAQLYMAPLSPAMSQTSYNVTGPVRTASKPATQWQPYSRGQSVTSARSQRSVSNDSDDTRIICTWPSCGRPIRDMKAHMLTHQPERPEKCPIASCSYNTKGFARKYDRTRHTLTHYKGTMVCDFCPGSGSSAEKSFNRTDVFKRHLQSVHGSEQTAPSSRRRKTTRSSLSSSSSASGTVAVAKKPRVPVANPGVCRTCGVLFTCAQELHDHIDDCVLRVVQQTEPSEVINEALLSSVADDEDLQACLSRHNLSASRDGPTSFDEDGDDDSADPNLGNHS